MYQRTRMSTNHPSPVAIRYAQAAVQQAVATSSLPALVTSTQTLLGSLTSATMAQLALPTLRPAQRLALVQAVAKDLALPPLLTNLLQLMAQAKRLDYLADTLTTILTMAAVHQGALPVRYEGTTPLTPAQQTQLKKHLATAFPKAKSFHLTQSIVPALRAGYRLFAGGKVWDMSLTGRLQQLATHLSSNLAK